MDSRRTESDVLIKRGTSRCWPYLVTIVLLAGWEYVQYSTFRQAHLWLKRPCSCLCRVGQNVLTQRTVIGSPYCTCTVEKHPDDLYIVVPVHFHHIQKICLSEDATVVTKRVDDFISHASVHSPSERSSFSRWPLEGTANWIPLQALQETCQLIETWARNASRSDTQKSRLLTCFDCEEEPYESLDAI